MYFEEVPHVYLRLSGCTYNLVHVPLVRRYPIMQYKTTFRQVAAFHIFVTPRAADGPICACKTRYKEFA